MTNTTDPNVGVKDHQTQSQNRDQASNMATGPEKSVNNMAIPRYPSYAEYIQHLRKDRPQFDHLYSCLTYNGSNVGAFRILFADCGPRDIRKTMLFSDPTEIFTTSPRATIDHDLNEKVIASLKSLPQEDVKVRIIVLELADPKQLSSTAIVDALGMIFDVPPAVFDSFFQSHPREHEDIVRRPLPNLPHFLRLHRCFVAHIINWIHGSGNLKIVLVLSFMTYWDEYIHGIMFDQSPSIHTTNPISYSKKSTVRRSSNERSIGWYSDIYWDWLSGLNHNQLELNIEQPLQFVYPWIKYQLSDNVAFAFLLRCEFFENLTRFSSIELDGDDNIGDTIFSWANQLRNFMADTQELHCEIMKLLDMASAAQSKELREISRMISNIVADGDRLLEMFAQNQQSLIGAMAIRESRKSLKDANSVKRLTQLAFVFIPLSYSSSLFGMNLIEMTGNGPRLWVFLITTLSLLLGGLSFWYLSESIQKRVNDRKQISPSFFTIAKIIYAGISTRNFVWMVHSGVLLGLITKNMLGKFGNNTKSSFDRAKDRFYEQWENRRRERKLRTSV